MVVAKPPRKECACILEEQQEGVGVEMCEWGQNGKRRNQRGKRRMEVMGTAVHYFMDHDKDPEFHSE